MFEPTADEVEYIKNFRKNRDKKSGLSKGGNFHLLCQLPENVWHEQQKLWRDKGGVGSWIQNDTELAKYLARNPQYKVGNPSL